VVLVECVPQTVAHHRVGQRRVAEFRSRAHVHAMRGLAHAFLSARHDDVGLIELQRLVAHRDRAQPRATELINAQGRRLVGNARRHGRLPRRILSRTRREDLAENNVRHLVGGHLRPL